MGLGLFLPILKANQRRKRAKSCVSKSTGVNSSDCHVDWELEETIERLGVSMASTLKDAIQLGLDEYTKRCQENPNEKLPAAEIIERHVLLFLTENKKW